jgi:hypothetical protein
MRFSNARVGCRKSLPDLGHLLIFRLGLLLFIDMRPENHPLGVCLVAE